MAATELRGATVGLALLVGCAPAADGLIVEESTVAFRDGQPGAAAPASDAGPGTSVGGQSADGGLAGDAASEPQDPPVATLPCQNVSLFSAQVAPLFLEHCARCHDGTKGKATRAFDLTLVRDASPQGQAGACRQTLASVVEAEPSQNLVFRKVDPADTEIVHDFKFETAAEFEAYRDAVLAWLVTE